ncbi:MAG: hypothetical protein ACT4QF_04400 [Sporichthyaceae bacterium]
MSPPDRLATRPGRLLEAVAGAVALYAACMVVAPATIDRLLFAPLGFGVPGPPTHHDRLLIAVLGSAILGWMTLLMLLARRAATDPSIWWAVSCSTAVWFAGDTGVSLTLGYPGHAAFNVAFGAAVGCTLVAVRPRFEESGGEAGGVDRPIRRHIA